MPRTGGSFPHEIWSVLDTSDLLRNVCAHHASDPSLAHEKAGIRREQVSKGC
jgi:hypothetical protein